MLHSVSIVFFFCYPKFQKGNIDQIWLLNLGALFYVLPCGSPRLPWRLTDFCITVWVDNVPSKSLKGPRRQNNLGIPYWSIISKFLPCKSSSYALTNLAKMIAVFTMKAKGFSLTSIIELNKGIELIWRNFCYVQVVLPWNVILAIHKKTCLCLCSHCKIYSHLSN